MQPQSTATPTPPPASAMTAAGSMGRFLARHPQFATADALSWFPYPNGDLTVKVVTRHPDAPEMVAALGSALHLQLIVTRFQSPESGEPMVSLMLHGRYDGADWLVDAGVTADVYAEFVAKSLAVAA